MYDDKKKGKKSKELDDIEKQKEELLNLETHKLNIKKREDRLNILKEKIKEKEEELKMIKTDNITDIVKLKEKHKDNEKKITEYKAKIYNEMKNDTTIKRNESLKTILISKKINNINN